MTVRYVTVNSRHQVVELCETLVPMLDDCGQRFSLDVASLIKAAAQTDPRERAMDLAAIFSDLERPQHPEPRPDYNITKVEEVRDGEEEKRTAV